MNERMQRTEDDLPIERQDRFIKWIPVVVPLAALVLAALVFFILAEVA